MVEFVVGVVAGYVVIMLWEMHRERKRQKEQYRRLKRSWSHAFNDLED